MHDPRYVLRIFLKFGKSHPKCSYKLVSYTKKGTTYNFFEYVLFELLPKKCKDILISYLFEIKSMYVRIYSFISHKGILHRLDNQ